MEILDRQVRKLRTKEVASVKVLWRNQFVEEATWEAEEDMKKRYPHLFEPREISDQVMAASPSPQPMVVGETNVNPNTCRTYASAISGNQQSSEKSLKPVILLHGEPTMVFDSKDIETFIMEENLKYALIAQFSHGRPELPDLWKILPQQLGFKGEFGQPLDVDRATYDKTRPSTARVKVKVNLLRILPKKIRVQFNDLVTGEITNVWQKIRLKIGEKDETVKDLDVGAEKSGVQDQNLVRQNSGQRLSKAMLDDYSSGNQMLSLIPQTGESSRQSCNSVDRVGVEKQLVVHSN
ncbi:hypothetical protein MTR67_044996 [Solanum verrucosum]|uniref:Chromo domain-containing protein n=1 Tax=Solanum verrucosum TaxID=315347 RepID=A0AAF0UV11_SOLVR|nr:hypothetical protein MTR67_044996 [Solanum verrucosum]